MPDTPDDPWDLFDLPPLPDDGEARVDEGDDWADRIGPPLEGAIAGMLAELRCVIAAATTRAPQRYGYALTWGLVPEMLNELPAEEHDGHMQMRRVFYVLTPGGEFLALNRGLMANLQKVLSRVWGGSRVMDMEPGWGTWSTAPGMPITQLDFLFMAIPEHLADTTPEHCPSSQMTLNAHTMGEPMYLTCPRRPDGWPL